METYLDLGLSHVLGLRDALAQAQARWRRGFCFFRRTRLLTTTLLSLGPPAALVGACLVAAAGFLEFFCTPPTGAAVMGRPAERRRLRPPRRPPALRWVETISSKDWSSLPDMVADEENADASVSRSPVRCVVAAVILAASDAHGKPGIRAEESGREGRRVFV
jgi:hypothetical protein